MSDIGSEIKRLRLKIGINQTELAKAVGLSPSYISRLERGDRGFVRMELIDKLAKALNLDIQKRNELRLMAGFAPVLLNDLKRTNPTLQLMADFFDDELIPDEEKDVIKEHVRLINKRWNMREDDL